MGATDEISRVSLWPSLCHVVTLMLGAAAALAILPASVPLAAAWVAFFVFIGWDVFLALWAALTSLTAALVALTLVFAPLSLASALAVALMAFLGVAFFLDVA